MVSIFRPATECEGPHADVLRLQDHEEYRPYLQDTFELLKN